ncbi:MAG: hypothetical protein ACI9FJ_001043, partial [Alteromonadaceae bacterium]
YDEGGLSRGKSEIITHNFYEKYVLNQ